MNVESDDMEVMKMITGLLQHHYQVRNVFAKQVPEPVLDHDVGTGGEFVLEMIDNVCQPWKGLTLSTIHVVVAGSKDPVLGTVLKWQSAPNKDAIHLHDLVVQSPHRQRVVKVGKVDKLGPVPSLVHKDFDGLFQVLKCDVLLRLQGSIVQHSRLGLESLKTNLDPLGIVFVVKRQDLGVGQVPGRKGQRLAASLEVLEVGVNGGVVVKGVGISAVF